MKQFVKGFIKGLVPARLTNLLTYEEISKIHKTYQDKYEYSKISFSQEGEDLVMERIFGDKPDGFFVDIGAHHPRRFSNTFHFYNKGWRGINVDPMPGSMDAFKEQRPRDINLEFGIAGEEGKLEYFIFNEPALNTFSREEADKKHNKYGYQILRSVEIKTYRLQQILEKYLPAGKKIDFISIDVEGLDLVVLQSNDWNRFRPSYVLIEELNEDISTVLEKSKVNHFMTGIKYSLVSRTYNTSIYKADEIN